MKKYNTVSKPCLDVMGGVIMKKLIYKSRSEKWVEVRPDERGDK